MQEKSLADPNFKEKTIESIGLDGKSNINGKRDK